MKESIGININPSKFICLESLSDIALYGDVEDEKQQSTIQFKIRLLD